MRIEASEILRYEGRTLSVTGSSYRGAASWPLGDFHDRSGRRPWVFGITTSMDRGYVGRWQVVEKRLYLVALTWNDVKGNALGAEFPGYPKRVFAHWYSGQLCAPLGPRLPVPHPLFVGLRERELVLDFESGVLVRAREIRNEIPVIKPRPPRRLPVPSPPKSEVEELEAIHGPLRLVFRPKPADLVQRISPQEAADREHVADPLGAVPALPFGHLHGTWCAFVASLERGDELWAFRARYAVPHFGIPEPASGYAIVRQQRLVGHFVAHRSAPAQVFQVSYAPRFPEAGPPAENRTRRIRRG